MAKREFLVTVAGNQCWYLDPDITKIEVTVEAETLGEATRIYGDCFEKRMRFPSMTKIRKLRKKADE